MSSEELTTLSVYNSMQSTEHNAQGGSHQIMQTEHKK